MNKEILQKSVEQDVTSHCKNCGADLFESGSSITQKSTQSNSVEAVHVVCNKCGYIQVVKQSA